MKEDGTIQKQYDYAPFGGVLWSNLRPNRTGYIGKEKDHENSLADHGVRKYDDGIGRFTSIDPLWEKYYSWSPYHYCRNNPVWAVDGNGLWAWVINRNPPHQYMANMTHILYWIDPYEKLESLNKFSPLDLQDKLNSFHQNWNNSNSRHFAPKVAEYLKNNSIRVGLFENMGNIRGGHYEGDILLSDALYRGKTDGTYLEKTFFHEIIHAMGYDEFGVRAAVYAVGFGSKNELKKLINSNYGFNYFKKGMPEYFNKYFKSGKIIKKTENEFWNEFYNYGMSIIGN